MSSRKEASSISRTDDPAKHGIVKRIRKHLKRKRKIRIATQHVRGKTKYFCIGRNKTGTTSMQKAFEDLSFIVGDQRSAAILSDRHYFAEEFRPIIKYCKTAQVFQDAP